jgi:predicted metal-dependent phosphotriesterase family hydrolase/GNAT superfamily N-acetyltransferase
VSQPFVETVLGPAAVASLGRVMPHEHFPCFRGVTEDVEPPVGYRAELDRLEREAIREVQPYGVGAFVEVTPIGMLRMVPMMQRLSRDTGLHVIASTGFYLPGVRPAWVAEKSAEDLAELFVRELTVGMEGSDAKAWMIKLAANGLQDSPECQKVFRAAALASRATGAAITTHSCHCVREHFDFLVEAGADPTRCYIGHADLVGDDSEYRHIAAAGGHLIFTCWGIEHFVPQDLLASRVVALAEAGYAQAVLISIDYALILSANRMDLISTEYECPRRTPAFLFRYAWPKLREKGLSAELFDTFTVDNPRTMLTRPQQVAEVATTPAEVRSGLRLATFSSETEADAIALVNGYTAGWPYSRPIDAELVARWKTLGEHYQPEHMLLACRDGVPRAFLHGERRGDCHYAHLVAMAPGAVEEGVWLLEQAEAQARAEGATRLCGPTCVSNVFYGGYVLGLEPYHPHWALDGTQAFVQAGYHMVECEALMVAEPPAVVPAPQVADGYEIVEGDFAPEYRARGLRLTARHAGQEVATCGVRIYPDLKGRFGAPIGQLGFVGTEPEHRGKGLATALVMRGLQLLWEWGAGEVLISTGLENYPALRAYARAGFRRKHNQNEWQKQLASSRG